MRTHPRGCGRSVDRGMCRPGIELRNPCPAPTGAGRPGCRGGGDTPKATPCLPWALAQWRGRHGPRAVTDPVHARKHLVREPGDPASFCGPPAGVCCRAHREAFGRTTMSHGRGKSDRGVVPKKLPNKAAGDAPAAAEAVEGRLRAKGNAVQQRMSRRSMRVYDMQAALDGIRQTARCCSGTRLRRAVPNQFGPTVGPGVVRRCTRKNAPDSPFV